MVPHVAPLHPAPLTLHVTPTLEAPVTVAVNCWIAPAATVVLVGDTVIVAPVVAETFRVAALLVALPALLLTTTVNSARLSAAVVGGVVYVEEVAPLIAVPFFRHWYLNGAVPVTATEKFAVCPAVTSALTGCEVMEGTSGAPLPLGSLAGLLALVKPAHPER
ncbi:MAG: hypothetical protein WA857_16770 [Candidatus Acidiferrum sp.]